MDRGALTWLGLDRDPSARKTDPLVEAHQPQATATRVPEIEPAAVIANRQHQVGSVAPYVHPHVAGFRMPAGISQCFLGHSVQAERDVGRDGSEVLVGPECHRQAMLALELATMAPEGGGQAGVLQDPGMELV